MRVISVLAAILTLAGCSSTGPKQAPQLSRSQTIRVPEAYPTKMGTAQGPVIGSDAPAAWKPSGGRKIDR